MQEHGGETGNAEELKSYLGTKPKDNNHLEGVLASVRRPGDYTYKVCKRSVCKQPFGTNYLSVAYCSDLCRIRDFEELTGCKWNPHKSDEERWGGEPPVIIPPHVLKTMYQYSKRIVAEFERLGMTEDSLQDVALLPEQELSSLDNSQPKLDPKETEKNQLPSFLQQPVLGASFLDQGA